MWAKVCRGEGAGAIFKIVVILRTGASKEIQYGLKAGEGVGREARPGLGWISEGGG